MIVGDADEHVLALNRRAFELLPGTKALHVVPGGTHLFEEPGALEEVAALSAEWFSWHFEEARAGDASVPGTYRGHDGSD